MPRSPSERIPGPTDPSRRTFLGRLAHGSLGLAVAPSLALDAAGAWGQAPLSAPAASPGDEAFWREVRGRFDLRPGVVPMNAANLCPAPRSVVEAAARAQRDVDGDVSFQNRDKYSRLLEEARTRIAGYLGASPDEIAVVRNTSEANNIVVWGLDLEPGDEVLLFDQNHPTNSVAWKVRAARSGFAVREVGFREAPASAEEIVEAFRAALSPRTRVLAFSDVSNSTGLRMPTRELCRLARERGIHAHVDGAQTLGALRRDLHDLGCDSYAASAHKWLMGPKEAGVLFVRQERVQHLWPSVVGVGWGSGAETEAEGARKFETLGQRNDATLAALDATVELHEWIGPERVEARIMELSGALKAGLAEIPGARLVTSTDPALSAGVVVVRFEGRDHPALFQRLYAEHGIAGAPTGGLRLCPHVYNTREDVERALEAVRVVSQA